MRRGCGRNRLGVWEKDGKRSLCDCVSTVLQGTSAVGVHIKRGVYTTGEMVMPRSHELVIQLYLHLHYDAHALVGSNVNKLF